MAPPLSKHFANREPSPIRQAQILFANRPDKEDITVINMAIGNVSLPMHPAMRHRMEHLGDPQSPFTNGVVKYAPSVGSDEAQAAFINTIASAGFSTDGIECVVTDGGSMAMELMILGICGPRAKRPLALLDPAYTNYMDIAKRAAVPYVSISRILRDDGTFGMPNIEALNRLIEEQQPAGLVVIVADNPTGQLLRQKDLNSIATLCVRHNIWLVSDEAYRQLHYTGDNSTSIWGLSEGDIPGIVGRRISIESASKVWNACGLRVGALVTDNHDLHTKAVAEHTANLSSNVIGQYIFGALAHQSHTDLGRWYQQQRQYYSNMMRFVSDGLKHELPGLIVSLPEASLYSVLDVRNVAPKNFSATDFVAYCAKEGRVAIDGCDHTLLVAPMEGFYGTATGASRTQMRLAYVAPMPQMKKVPLLFAKLFEAYLSSS